MRDEMASTKEAIALAIRRRNGLQTSATHSQQSARSGVNMNRTVVYEHELDIARKLSFSAALADPTDNAADDDDAGETSRVQIVIRIRPLASGSAASIDSSDCFRIVSDTTMVAQPPAASQSYRSTGAATSFQFSRIFAPATAQRELFVATTKPVLQAAFNGKSGLVFAYGVTNSGKTYTISGTDEHPGMLPRALAFVIKELRRRKENDAAPVTHVTASYLEIYNDNVYDLLATPTRRKRRALRLQDCDGTIQVRGMLEKPIATLADGQALLTVGLQNKQVAETRCNVDSSRSHCVFTLHFYHAASGGGAALRSKVSIVDLAGSERSAKTGATGLRMQESSKINGSLMNLMRCLETLRWNQQHAPALHKMVPFRESKLTRLFQENLVGKARGPLVMIVAVNPSSHEFDETLRTLKYSAVARELVPVQQPVRPTALQTRSQARRAGTTTFFYDLDGRLKTKAAKATSSKALETDKETTAATETDAETPSMRSAVRKHRDPVLAYSTAAKLASVKRARDVEAAMTSSAVRATATKRVKHAATADATATDTLVDLVRSEEPSSGGDAASKALGDADVARLEYHAMEIRVTELELENDDLRRQLSAVNAEKLALEVQIRAELGEQMHAQLQQIKAQYQDMAVRRGHRSGGDATERPSARKAADADESERTALQHQVHQLQRQLNECEDEMARVRARHERELEALRHPIKREQ